MILNPLDGVGIDIVRDSDIATHTSPRGRWGDGARQYDNGNDATPEVTNSGQGWPTWEPPVPGMRCLWFSQMVPQLTDGASTGNGWAQGSLGTGATAGTLKYDSSLGLYRACTTGSTSTGLANWVMGGSSSSCILPAVGSHVWRYEAVFRIPTLSDGVTEKFYVNVGFLAAATSGAPGNSSACFNFPDTGGNIQAVCRDNGTESAVDTGIAPSANTWYRVVIVITNNTQVDFYITTLGTALPTTPVVTATTYPIPVHSITAGACILKTAGVTGRELDIYTQLVSWNLLAA